MQFMLKQDAGTKALLNLRKRAEQQQLADGTLDSRELHPTQSKLIHELRTHQIELEMQNEELRLAQVELLESHDQYSDLYDFAPVGYATVSHQGLIVKANLTLAEMFGVERGTLVSKPLFTHRVAPCRQRGTRPGAGP